MKTRELRDELLLTLKTNFTPDQLQLIDNALMNILNGMDIKPMETSLITIGGCVPEVLHYLARKKAKGLAESTITQYTLVLKHFCCYIQKNIEDITEWDILNFLDHYEKTRGISKRRKDTMRVILNGFFRYMADCGKITINPMATIEPIKYKKNIREPLTDIELEKLRYACKKPKERALLEFFFATGCRVSEVVSLNITDIDFNNRMLKVTGKGNKERIVCLNASAAIALRIYLDTRVDTGDALFVSDRRPYQRIKKEALEKIIRTLGQRAEIGRRVYPHLIRHTTATYLLRHGMPLEHVQDYLGHENINTTRIYAKSDKDAMIANYKKCMVL